MRKVLLQKCLALHGRLRHAIRPSQTPAPFDDIETPSDIFNMTDRSLRDSLNPLVFFADSADDVGPAAAVEAEEVVHGVEGRHDHLSRI